MPSDASRVPKRQMMVRWANRRGTNFRFSMPYFHWKVFLIMDSVFFSRCALIPWFYSTHKILWLNKVALLNFYVHYFNFYFKYGDILSSMENKYSFLLVHICSVWSRCVGKMKSLKETLSTYWAELSGKGSTPHGSMLLLSPPPVCGLPR